MGPSPSTIDQEKAQEVSDERFKRLLDAETLQKTFSQTSQGTEQTVFLGVHGWHTEEPSIYLMLDERPCNKLFDGWLNAKETALEFRFKIAADYPDSRARIPAYIEGLLSNKDLLGISTLYIGPDPVKQCMDVLKKARSRRPRWSEPISLYNAQFSWMKRSPQSPSLYLKMAADSDEVCILIVNENTPVYKNEFGSDVVSRRAPTCAVEANTSSTNSSKSLPSLCGSSCGLPGGRPSWTSTRQLVQSEALKSQRDSSGGGPLCRPRKTRGTRQR